MVRSFVSSFLLVFLLGSSFSPGFSQNAPPQTPPTPKPQAEPQDTDPDDTLITVGTQLLQLDTVVTDKQGKPVENLRREDFELLEDGKPQDIAFFSMIRNGVAVPAVGSAATTAPKPGDPTLGPTEGRVFAIVVDDFHIKTGNLVYLKKALLEIIEKKIGEGDSLLVVSTSGSIGFLQQVTDDKRVMRAAIEKISPQNRLQGPAPGQGGITPYQAILILRNDPDAIQLGIQQYLRESPGMSQDMARSQVDSIARQIARETENFTQASIETIRLVMKALAGYRGRKSLILASDGFLTDDFNGNGRNQVQRVLDSATRAGVTVYSISSAGLETVGFDAASQGNTGPVAFRIGSQELSAKLDAMREIAGSTGGFTLNNTNDLTGAFQKVVADNEIYYVLAYYPDKKPDGKFHKIQIRVKSAVKYTVRGRTGFLAPDEKAIQKAAEKKQKKDAGLTPEALQRRELQGAIGALSAPTDIPVRVSSFFSGNDVDTAFSLAIDLRSVRFQDVAGKKANTLTSAFVIYGIDGKVVNAVEDSIGLNFTPSRFEEVSKTWFSQVKGQALKPGLYNVRFAVFDPLSGLKGAVSKWVEIPDLAKPKMALSDILFLRETKTGPAGAEPPQNATQGILPPGYSPANQALRRYSAKDNLAFFVRAFNVTVPQPPPAVSNLGFQVQIYQGKQLMFASPVQRTKTAPVAGGVYNYASQISIEGLKPGKYLLKIVAFETTTKVTAVQQGEFFVD